MYYVAQVYLIQENHAPCLPCRHAGVCQRQPWIAAQVVYAADTVAAQSVLTDRIFIL